MNKLLIVIHFVITLFIATAVIYAETCEDAGACTLSNGACGVECNGNCLPLDEAKCCLSGMCYRNGSWCGGVECNGECFPLDEAKCCLSGCNYVNGVCDCEGGN